MKIILSLLIVILINQNLFAESPVDTTLVKYIDVTGDKVNDKVELHLKSKDFHEPFNWTIRIKSNNHIIYQYSETDQSSESRILLETEEGRKYENVKKEFYYKNFVGLTISKEVNFGGGQEYLFSKSYEGSIYFVTKKYLLKECGISEDKAIKIIDKLVKNIKSGKSIIVSHTIQGLYSSKPMIYVDDVKKLVPIYSN